VQVSTTTSIDKPSSCAAAKNVSVSS
jgi:hypothetical protein